MQWPSVFFYQANQSKEGYTEIQSGVLSVPQVILGRSDYWVATACARESKKKSLIISDWTAPHWTRKRKQRVIEVLTDLMAENFSCYLYQQDKLTRLTSEELPSFLNYDYFKPTLPNERDKIIKLAQEKNLSVDGIHILDDYWLRMLCARSPNGELNLNIPRVLVFEWYHSIAPDIEAETLSQLEQLTPAISVIEHTFFSEQNNTELNNFLKKNTFSKSVITDYEKVKITPELLSWLENKPKENFFEINGRCLSFEEFNQIRAIEIFGEERIFESAGSSLSSDESNQTQAGQDTNEGNFSITFGVGTRIFEKIGIDLSERDRFTNRGVSELD